MDVAPCTLKKITPDDPVVARLPELIRFTYESRFFYEVEARRTAGGHSWDLVRRPATPPLRKDERWKPFSNGNDARGYVAMAGETPVAYAEYGFRQWQGLVHVWHFYVNDEHRRMGVGSAMMEEIEQAARHFQARGVILETQSSNVPAIDFYRSRGFEFWGLNTRAYSNTDIEDRNVFLIMGKVV